MNSQSFQRACIFALFIGCSLAVPIGASMNRGNDGGTSLVVAALCVGTLSLGWLVWSYFGGAIARTWDAVFTGKSRLVVSASCLVVGLVGFVWSLVAASVSGSDDAGAFLVSALAFGVMFATGVIACFFNLRGLLSIVRSARRLPDRPERPTPDSPSLPDSRANRAA